MMTPSTVDKLPLVIEQCESKDVDIFPLFGGTEMITDSLTG